MTVLVVLAVWCLLATVLGLALGKTFGRLDRERHADASAGVAAPPWSGGRDWPTRPPRALQPADRDLLGAGRLLLERARHG